MATINGTSGNDIIDARSRTDDLTIYGKAGNDTIYGGKGTDKIYGGGGSDYIYASPLDKLIHGGAGNDTLDFSLYVADASGQGVNARLAGGDLGLWPNQNGSPVYVTGAIKYVENLIGSNYDDALMGNNAVNKISGGAGDDWIIGWGSGDFLTGGADADMFVLEYTGTKTTITDFNYSEGDRLHFDVAPEISWRQGTGLDANGVSHSAYIGTYIDEYSNTERVILLDVTTQPSSDWIVSLG
jgi:Ca2+-binding RTX toxin-like protein